MRKISMLHHLEVAAKGRDERNYPISEKLLDPTRLNLWRRNIWASGSEEDQKRYAKAITSEAVTEKLPLHPEGC